MTCHKADTLDAFDFRHVVQQKGKIGRRTVRGPPPIAVDVLPEERDFFDTLVGKLRTLDQNVHHGSTDFCASRIRDDAVRAKVTAPFHDGTKGRCPLNTGLRQAVKLFDFGKRGVDLGLTCFQPFFK